MGSRRLLYEGFRFRAWVSGSREFTAFGLRAKLFHWGLQTGMPPKFLLYLLRPLYYKIHKARKPLIP